jgi:hypothetical protein
MYIKEVSIDGFKSYAQRVCLTNFDPGFNAITGLNGSGKSNILDSLCFVMGIKNLSAVRNSSSQPGTPAALASSCCDLGVHSSALSCVYTTVFHTLHILKQPHMLVNIWQILYPVSQQLLFAWQSSRASSASHLFHLHHACCSTYHCGFVLCPCRSGQRTCRSLCTSKAVPASPRLL